MRMKNSSLSKSNQTATTLNNIPVFYHHFENRHHWKDVNANSSHI